MCFSKTGVSLLVLSIALLSFVGSGCSSSGGGDCEPDSCADLNHECGTWDDGCGAVVACGDCPGGYSCDDGTCVSGCTPQTCGQMNRECGNWDDGCGTQLNCGSCSGDEMCQTNTGQCVTDCMPWDCTQMGYECGVWDDGCGTDVNCGSCPNGQNCNTTNGQCVTDCTPQDCDQMSRQCGVWDDGCGTDVDCGNCSNGQTCNTATGQCVTDCTPQDCNQLGRDCGTWDDGCGTDVHCGSCPNGQTCNTTTGQCVSDCDPQDCNQLNRDCGSWDDGCGTQIDCGSCPNGQSCNTSTGQCVVDCTPQNCNQLGRECGNWDDGCGTQINCGTCGTDESCSSDGQCVANCTPQSCDQLNYQCGSWDNGCGTQINCGSCGSGQTCVEGLCRSQPVLTLDSQAGGSFTLRWTYAWSGLASTSEHYELEESTSGVSSGFSVAVETTWGDRTSPWLETLSRSNGTYYYRVRAFTASGVTPYSDVLTVDVSVQPPRLRIINDLYNQQAGVNNWAQMNQLYRIWIAGDATSLQNCTDSCDRLDPASGNAPGQVLLPDPSGNSYLEFDVSMYSDGEYCVFLDCGWWEYFCPSSCYWAEHATQVVCCDGETTCWKNAGFCVNGHFGDVFVTYASEWLPQGNWTGTEFCD